MLARIEAFLAVAQRRSVSQAAASLGLSQPTLTARLQSLETELGTQLFVRTRRGMRLTEAGDAFLPYAQRAVEALRAGRELLDELRRGEAGRLVLATPPTVSTYALPLLLTRFRAEHPNVRLIVKTGYSEEILQMVLREEVQLGLTRALSHPDVEAVPVYSDRLLLAAAAGHPLTKQEDLPLTELAGETLILFGRSSSFRELALAIFRQAGVLPASVIELDNIEAAKKMVERGLGIALLPASAVAAELAAGALNRIDTPATRSLRRDVVAVRRHDAGLPAGPVRQFLELLMEMRGDLERLGELGTPP